MSNFHNILANFLIGPLQAFANSRFLKIPEILADAQVIQIVKHLEKGDLSYQNLPILIEYLFEENQKTEDAKEKTEKLEKLEKIDEIKNETETENISKTVLLAIQKLGILQNNDENLLLEIVEAIIAENPSQVAQYLSGKTTVLSFLIGQAMKKSKTQGQAGNPKKFEEILLKKLVAVG